MSLEGPGRRLVDEAEPQSEIKAIKTARDLIGRSKDFGWYPE